jgi:hypothetical protein
MPNLESLDLGSITSVKSLEPLAEVQSLLSLAFGNANHITDYSPLGKLVGLRQLCAHGSPSESIKFLPRLTSLRVLDWSVVPKDLDYSPLLELHWVESMWVTERKGMRPSLAELEWQLPGIQARLRESLGSVTYRWELGEKVGEYRTDSDGETYLHRYDGTRQYFHR